MPGSGGSDEFGRAVAKIGVAQICEGLGFHACQRSAAETLADIALRYLGDLAKAAHFYANLAGRTECNALDVIMAMEDLSTGPSSAATDTTRPLSSSKPLQEVMRYVEYSEDIPFPRPLPHFPVTKKRVVAPSFADLGEVPPFPHIPSWLPAFPDPHTYKSTPVWDERKSDPRRDKLELARQQRKGSESFVSMHMRLSSIKATMQGSLSHFGQTDPSSSAGGSAGPSTALVASRQMRGPSSSLVPLTSPSQPPASEQEALLSKLESEGQGKVKGRRVAASQNPFLASPFAAGEKEVSTVSFPGKGVNSSKPLDTEGKMTFPSAMETFAPALEAAKHASEHMDTYPDRSGSVLLEAKYRRPVLMSFDWGRKAHGKALTAQLIIGALNRSPTRPVPGKDEEKDDRKRRAEQILAQSYLDGMDESSQP